MSSSLCPARCLGKALPCSLGSAGHGTHLLCFHFWGLGVLDPSAELEESQSTFQDHFGLNPITLHASHMEGGSGGQVYHGWLVASCSHLFVSSYPEPKTAQRDTKKLQL